MYQLFIFDADNNPVLLAGGVDLVDVLFVLGLSVKGEPDGEFDLIHTGRAVTDDEWAAFRHSINQYRYEATRN